MSAAEDTPVSAAEAQSLFGGFGSYPVLVLAVSGGPDSTALLWLAARWRRALGRGPRLIAVTVDHGLRPESKAEALAVKRLARALGVEHRTLRWTGRKPKSGLQAAARRARYRLLADVARKHGHAPILTAHTLDDQAETVLFRMMRGSGIAGLAGMRQAGLLPGHEHERIGLFRPLLEIPKSRLIATLKAENIPYIEDPSNRDPRFARTRLRQLMPRLAAEGLTSARLARLAKRALRADAAVQEASQAVLQRLAPGPWPKQGPVSFAVEEFQRLPEELRLRVLETAVNRIGDEGPVELGALEALSEALGNAIEMSRGAAGRPKSFRRTLAGAIVTLRDGQVRIERAPPRRSRAQKRP